MEKVYLCNVMMTFNTEQQQVIEALGGYHLVLAPPGCGKTAVLAERIVWAHEHGVDFADMAVICIESVGLIFHIGQLGIDTSRATHLYIRYDILSVELADGFA